MKIIKRSGTEVAFDAAKIAAAIAKANAATTGARELTPGAPCPWRRSRSWWRPS